IAASGTVTITDSSFISNVSDGASAGAITNGGNMSISRSSFKGNGGVFGGGAVQNFGSLTIANSTFTGNYGSASSTSTISSEGNLKITNSTIAGNAGGFGDPCSAAAIAGGHSGSVTLQNTILAGNGTLCGHSVDCFGSITSLNNNRIGDPTGCTITLLS